MNRRVRIIVGATLSYCATPVFAQEPVFLRTGDYPEESIKRGEEGTVFFTVRVNADGQATDCNVDKSSGYERLDKKTCELMLRRGQFRPKIDVDGKAVESNRSNSIFWKISPYPMVSYLPVANNSSPTILSNNYLSFADYPKESISRREQGTVRFTLTVSAEGRATACHVNQSSGFAALDDKACQIMIQRAMFNPAMDSAGNPTTDFVSSSVRWVIPAH